MAHVLKPCHACKTFLFSRKKPPAMLIKHNFHSITITVANLQSVIFLVGCQIKKDNKKNSLQLINIINPMIAAVV